MLKKLVYLVVILIFIGPTYDLTKATIHKASKWLDESPWVEQLQLAVEDVSVEQVEQLPNTARELTEATATEIQNLQIPQSPNQIVVTSQAELADAFYTSFKNWQTEFDITYKGSTKNIEKTIETAVNEALGRDDYIFGHTGKRSIKYDYSKTAASIHVEQSYLTTPQQEAIVEQRVSEIVGAWQGYSDFEKVRAVHDYIVKHTVYTTESSTSPHSSYAVLIEEKGVCQGYALLSLKMLQLLGIEAKYIVGYVGAEGHAWNLVKLDGQWYHLDPTWDDPVPDRAGVVRYEYFLVDDKTLARDHSWIESDYPTATSKRFAAMHNADYAIEQNGQLYYSNIQDHNILYQMDLTTLQTSRLTNSRALYLVGYGDWIYFSNYSKGAYLAKIKMNGAGETILYKEDSKDLFIEDGYLYFTANGQQRLKLD